MVKKWNADFKRGRDSLEDDPRRRRPVTVTTHETIAKIHDIIMAGRRVTELHLHFLGCRRSTVSWTTQRRVILSPEPIMLIFWDSYGRKSNRFSEENWKRKRSAFSPGQCSGTHVLSGRDCNPEMWPTLFSWFDYYLFPKIKKELSGHHFGRYDDVMNAVDHFRLHDCWTKCVNVEGEYAENLLHLIF